LTAQSVRMSRPLPRIPANRKSLRKRKPRFAQDVIRAHDLSAWPSRSRPRNNAIVSTGTVYRRGLTNAPLTFGFPGRGVRVVFHRVGMLLVLRRWQVPSFLALQLQPRDLQPPSSTAVRMQPRPHARHLRHRLQPRPRPDDPGIEPDHDADPDHQRPDYAAPAPSLQAPDGGPDAVQPGPLVLQIAECRLNREVRSAFLF
jgi:hypothetical protein